MKPITPRLLTQYAVLFAALAGLVASPAARADYVPTAKEERDWTARIAKSPPSAATLGGAPYPGAKLDTRRSGEKTAENQGEPMVYFYVVRASIGDVRAYYNGPGKREAGVPVLNQSDGSVEIMYYMHKNKPAAAAQPARVTAAPAKPVTESAPTAAAAPEPTPAPAAPQPAPAAPVQNAPAAPDTAKQATDAVNALRGLFGR